jgi:hypothetical protein
MLCFQSLEQQRQRNTSVQSLNMSEASGISVASKGPLGAMAQSLGSGFDLSENVAVIPQQSPNMPLNGRYMDKRYQEMTTISF